MLLEATGCLKRVSGRILPKRPSAFSTFWVHFTAGFMSILHRILLCYDTQCALLILLAWLRQSLCKGTVSVRLSVCPIYRPLQQRAAGLLPWAWRTGDIDRQRRPSAPRSTAHSSTAFSSKCEQCHVVSRRRKLNADVFVVGCSAGSRRCTWRPSSAS